MDSVIATVSGYHGSERFKLIKLISQAGASYVGALSPSTTHLVCWKFEGKKYDLAKKFRIVIVNHRWVEECVRQGRLVPERPFTKSCGLEVGSLQLEIHGVLRELSSDRNVSKEPVIDVECDKSSDEDWTDSLLLKENLLSELRQNRDRSSRLKRKGSKRNSRQALPCGGYNVDEPPSFGFGRIESEDLSCPSSSRRASRKMRSTTAPESSRSSRRLVHKNICNEVLESSSDSGEDCHPLHIQHHDFDDAAPSTDCGIRKSRRPDNDRFRDNVERKSTVLEEVEELKKFTNIEDPTCTDGHMSSSSGNPEDHLAAVGVDLNGMESSPRLPTPPALSCVICWTDFSSTRGILPCGHRFCFSCIQSWADRMASMKKASTCPLCKANFISIKKMDDAVSSDQKIYSQTIPSNPSAMDVYVLPYGEAPATQTLPSQAPVCFQCRCREPAEFLIECHRCQKQYVHSYCLDPPQTPWVCIQCKDLRRVYHSFR